MKKNLIWLLAIALGACAPLAAPLPEPNAAPTLTPFPSPTVEWFPPTFTPEIAPTREILPTPAIQTELGEVIFRDDFLAADDWILPRTDRGLISVSNGEINLVINQPRTQLIGIREKPDYQSFYAQITASPILCSSADEYGFLFKVFGQDQYYRFGLNCAGEIRLDQVGGEGGTVLYPWTRSASLPAGAPSKSTLAVLVDGDQIILLINGDIQVSLANQQVTAGSFGVYARSGGDSALTVSFSDLIVREVLAR